MSNYTYLCQHCHFHRCSRLRLPHILLHYYFLICVIGKTLNKNSKITIGFLECLNLNDFLYGGPSLPLNGLHFHFRMSSSLRNLWILRLNISQHFIISIGGRSSISFKFKKDVKLVKINILNLMTSYSN
jgi:hypothetical protein